MASLDASMMNPRPVSPRLLRRIVAVGLFLIAATLAIGLVSRLYGDRLILAGHTKDQTLREVVIGGDVITVPSNLIRYSAQRREGVAERLDLYAHWPTLSGYSDAARDAFNGLTAKPEIVFLSFEERRTSRDMAGRLEPIYRKLTEGAPAIDTATGLEHTRLSEKSGYMNEELLVGARADGSAPFVARCLLEADDSASVAPCEYDVFVGRELSMMVRFPREMLRDWDGFERTIAAFANGLVAAQP